MKKIVCFVLLLFPLLGISQVSVSGKVTDSHGTPIPYVNVIFTNSNRGTTTDASGKFSLSSDKNYNEIEVSLIGFASKKVKLTKKKTANLTIVLSEGEELSEVVVVSKPKKALSKKENPAYKILQGIWANKSKKGIQNARAYQYKKHVSAEMGINNLDTIFLQKTLGNDYNEIGKVLAEKKFKGSLSMPIYLKESVLRVYGNNEIKKVRTDVEAERSQGVSERGFGLERISKAFDEFDVYDNSFTILNRPFVSPLSEYGYGSYHYVLNDTISQDGRKFYLIYFFPKVDGDLLLEGNFLVDDKTFIIKSIQMHTTAKTNLNLVRGLSFEKHFTIANDSIYLPEREVQEGDFTLLTKKDEEKGIFVRNIISYSDLLLDKPFPSSFYDEQIMQRTKNQFVKEDSYWQNSTNASREIMKTKTLINQIGNSKRIKLITNLADIVGTGHIDVNKFLQVGTYWQLYETNDVEKHRFRLGFRTFTSTEDRFRTYIYGAYGTGDNKFKYGVSAKYLLSEYPRISVGMAYQDDYEQLGNTLLQDDTNLTFRNAANFIINRGENFFLTKNRKVQGVVTYNFHNNLELSVFGKLQHSKPADYRHFSIGFNHWESNRRYTSYTDFNSGVVLSYTPNRNVYGYGVEQRYGEKIHSTYTFKYTKGVEGALNSKFNYDKIQFLVKKPITVWSFGMLNTAIEVGKTFGEVPLPMLSPTPSNQSFSLIPQTFALLDYYDFVTDTYINGHFEHHFNGFIMNKLPLIKKLRLRSLAFARFAYGTISDANIRTNGTNLLYNAPERLYWEYGFGIENIGFGNLRVFRVDFVWRNDFQNFNGPRSPKFGVRVGIQPIF